MLHDSIKKVSKWIIDFGEQVDKSFEDGWQWSDAKDFIDELFSAPAMVKAAPEAFKLIKAGLSPEDKAEWKEFVKDEFDIPDDEAEAKIEGASTLLVAFDDFIRLFKKPAA